MALCSTHWQASVGAGGRAGGGAPRGRWTEGVCLLPSSTTTAQPQLGVTIPCCEDAHVHKTDPSQWKPFFSQLGKKNKPYLRYFCQTQKNARKLATMWMRSTQLCRLLLQLLNRHISLIDISNAKLTACSHCYRSLLLIGIYTDGTDKQR